MNTDAPHRRNNSNTHPVRETKPDSNQNNVIFVGNKPLMNYITGVVVQFTKKNTDKVTIKARGKFISKAVDIAEVARRRFLSEHNICTQEILIGTEEYDKEEKKISVSTIEITLTKKG